MRYDVGDNVNQEMVILSIVFKCRITSTSVKRISSFDLCAGFHARAGP